MKILFLHGWHSVVGGVKPTYLKDQGNEVINPPLDDDDFVTAVARAQAEYDRHRPDVIVGSSRGGAVAMNIDSKSTPLVLLCPAWKRWGKVAKLKSNAVILHSRLDEVIPFEESEELLAQSKRSVEALIEVGGDHRLADEASLAVMWWACRELVSPEGLLGNSAESEFAVAPSKQPDAFQEASYICDACGEEIVIPLDLSEGGEQRYVEDCPVCCRASVIHVAINENGEPVVWAEPEQDHD